MNLELGEAAVITTAARQAVPNTVSTTSVDRNVIRSSVDSATSTTLVKHRSQASSPGSVSVTGVRKPRLVQLNSEKRVPTLPNGSAGAVRNMSQKVIVGGSNGNVKKAAGTEECDQNRRLSLGIHYIQSLSENDDAHSAVFYMTPSVGEAPSPSIGTGNSPAVPPGVGAAGARSLSAKSLGKGKDVISRQVPTRQQQQTKVPIGAPFAISVQFEAIPARGAELVVRQRNGKPAPAWVNLDKRDVELWGVPLKEHRGAHLLEIVESTEVGQRVVARMDLEVVEWE